MAPTSCLPFSAHAPATENNHHFLGPLNLFAVPDSDTNVPGTGLTCTAWLNRHNSIVDLTPSWDVIAPRTVRRADVVGRPLGRFIADDTTRVCFEMLLEQTRRELRPLRMVTRCDHPNQSRAMLLTFVPVVGGGIEIGWKIFAGVVADRVPQIPQQEFQPGELIRMCGWCHHVHTPEGWQPLEIVGPSLGLLRRVTLPPVTHGICGACSASLLVPRESAKHQLARAI